MTLTINIETVITIIISFKSKNTAKITIYIIATKETI